MPQRGRVVRFAIADEADAELQRFFDLALDFVGVGDADRPAGAAAARLLAGTETPIGKKG